MPLRQTKIVATVGPASQNKATILAMITAGVNVFRLNFSHQTGQVLQELAALIREVAAECQKNVAILADIQGPKIRIGRFVTGKIDLNTGDEFILDGHLNQLEALGNSKRVGFDYPTLPKEVLPNDVLVLNDGLIVLTVFRIQGQVIYTRVTLGGQLSDHKGINRLGGGLNAATLTSKDKADIQTAMSFKAEYLAISFPKNAADMNEARHLANEAGKKWHHQTVLIAKIERAEAIMALEELIAASDGIMVARGDLAIEVGAAVVPALQKKMIKLAQTANKLSITATQMMESMTWNQIPTRAEVSDVANAILDGSDAVMTSGETAVGRYPLETIKMMNEVCLATEVANSSFDADFLAKYSERVDQSIAYAALFTAHYLSVKAIVTLTHSGNSALLMSRHTINTPIIAFTPNAAVQRKMALYRNVHALLAPPQITLHESAFLSNIENTLLQNNWANKGDLIVLIWGEPEAHTQENNALKILRLGNL
ncbi:MAG: pyruvate kinase [Neisseriaceae bacterium]|nr:pyruvate kinase [Neisseriaceae bacterium]